MRRATIVIVAVLCAGYLPAARGDGGKSKAVENILKRFDLNHDGTIDDEERALSLGKKPPKKKSTGKDSKEKDATEKGATDKNSGPAAADPHAVGFSVGGAAPAGAAATPAAPTGATGAKEDFVNRKFKSERERQKAMLEEFDENQNGRLDKKELDKVKELYKSKPKADSSHVSAAATSTGTDKPADSKTDKDGEHKRSKSGVNARFDTDGDGKISPLEAAKARAELRGKKSN